VCSACCFLLLCELGVRIGTAEVAAEQRHIKADPPAVQIIHIFDSRRTLD
jgi:hypothetical protein